MKTIVLLSGGLDSAVVLAGCVADGDHCLALAFNYSQKHQIELTYAEQIARHYVVRFETINVPHLPLVDDVVFAGRNLVFAALSVAKAQADGYDRIAVGCNATDWPRFPDCRPDFWRAVKGCAGAYGIKVVVPLLYHSKRDVVEAARKLAVPIEKTWSCYSPRELGPCGECLACTTRQEAMK